MVIIMFIWKNIAVKTVERKIVEQRDELTKKYSKIVATRTEEMLRLTGLPFVWAVRKEMIRENYDQINEYLVTFIKEPLFRQILVVKSDGTIAVATDKKLEGEQFLSLYPDQPIDMDEIRVASSEEGAISMFAPVMGLNSRLGFIYIIMMPEPIVNN